MNISPVVKLQRRSLISPLALAYCILELTDYSGGRSRRTSHFCYSIGCFPYYSKRHLYY
jgi:hypothetical protein